MIFEQRQCRYIFIKVGKALAVGKDLLNTRLDTQVNRVFHHVEREVFERQFDVKEFDRMQKVLVLLRRIAHLIQRVQLLPRNLLFKQQFGVSKAQIDQLHRTT